MNGRTMGQTRSIHLASKRFSSFKENIALYYEFYYDKNYVLKFSKSITNQDRVILKVYSQYYDIITTLFTSSLMKEFT